MTPCESVAEGAAASSFSLDFTDDAALCFITRLITHMSAHVSVSGASAPYVKPLQDTMMRDPSCASYFTLSTVEYGPRGVTPRARTVVFEGFAVDIDDRFALSCKLSSNSNKFAKRASDEVEICWWFSSARVQFRFRGPMRFETSAQSGKL